MSEAAIRRVTRGMSTMERAAVSVALASMSEGLVDKMVTAMRREFGDDLWRKYDELIEEEGDTVVYSKTIVWKLTVTVRVRDIRRILNVLVERLAGPRPTTTETGA